MRRRHFLWPALVALAGLHMVPDPAPALTPVPVSIKILFDKGSADLTEEARRLLAGVPSYIHYGRKRCSSVRVSGHLDRAEARAGFQGRLDVKRATAVRDNLRAVPILEGHAFDVFAYGSERPEVPNAPDDEPRNRRVEINWGCPANR